MVARSSATAREKGTIFEGGIRVPFLVQWKGKLPTGRTYDRALNSLDFLPTALAISGTSTPPDVAFDGVNLVPYLTGERGGDPHDVFFWRMNFRCIWAVRMGDDKVIMQAHGKAPHPTSRTSRLVNLASDLKELSDLNATNPARARELRARYDAWNATLPEPLWKPEKGGR